MITKFGNVWSDEAGCCHVLWRGQWSKFNSPQLCGENRGLKSNSQLDVLQGSL